MKIALRNAALSSAIAAALLVSSAGAMAQSNGAASIGGVAIGNKIGGTVSVINAGSSESHATSSAAAQSMLSSQLTASGASVSANTSTDLQNSAWNYSQGGGSGTANAAGYAAAGAAGAAAIPGVGAAAGYSGAGSIGAISVGTNQGGYQEGQTTTSFSAGLTYTNTPTSVNGVAGQQVTVTDTKTADAFANNTSGNITLNTGTQAAPVQTVLGGANSQIASAGVFGAGAQAAALTTNLDGNVAAAVNQGAPVLIQTAISNGL